MKPIVTVVAFAAACVGAPVALHAQNHPAPEQTIYAPSLRPISLVQWSGRVSNEIESVLQYPSFPSNQVPADGVVQVKFRCGGSGAPDQVSVFKTSGSRSLDRAAVHAVKRLKQLQPVATGMPSDQNYIAMVLFATSPEEHARQLAMIKKDAARRNAWFKGGSRSADVGIMLAPVGS